MPIHFVAKPCYLWMTVHSQLSAEIARQLAPKLRPRYLALTTERFVYEEPDSVAVSAGSPYPDVGVSGAADVAKGGGKAGLSTVPLRLETLMPTAVPHVTVDYTQPPELPLESEEDAVWIRERLRN